jgi:hypothetical protein
MQQTTREIYNNKTKPNETQITHMLKIETWQQSNKQINDTQHRQQTG